MDYYNITVEDRIALGSAINVTAADQTALAGLGVANAFDLGRVNFFTNGFETRTQGVDAVLTHRTSTGFGTFSSSLAVNWNETEVTDVETFTRFVPVDAQRVANIEGLTPKWRGVLSTIWNYDIVSASARLNYFGEITSFNAAPVDVIPDINRQTFGDEFSFDLELSVTLADRFTLAAGVENLFDELPDREIRNIFPETGAQANGRLFNDASPLGYAGGFWYVRGRIAF